jgi:hypothetical protein
MIYQCNSTVDIPSDDVVTWAFANEEVADEHPVSSEILGQIRPEAADMGDLGQSLYQKYREQNPGSSDDKAAYSRSQMPRAAARRRSVHTFLQLCECVQCAGQDQSNWSRSSIHFFILQSLVQVLGLSDPTRHIKRQRSDSYSKPRNPGSFLSSKRRSGMYSLQR